MAEIKNVIKDSVHWHVKNVAYTGASAIKKGLPEELSCLLAELRVIGNNLSWIHQLSDWHAMGEANAQTQVAIKQLVADARNKIIAAAPNGRDLIKVPNDEEYVFFRTREGGGLQILFTGWGFLNSLNYVGGVGVIDGLNDKLQKVQIGFSIEGKLCPSRRFVLSAPDIDDKLATTSEEGLYNVGPLKTGISIIVNEINTGKTFTHIVSKGKENYIGDITEVVTVRVVLQRDGIPTFTNEKVTMEYCGDSRSFESQAGQSVNDRFVLREGEEMRVSAMGEVQSRILTCGENIFTFNVQTPPAKVRVRMNYSDGSPCVAETVKLMYGGKEYVGVTNGTGEVAFTMPYAQGQACKVTTSLGEEARILRIPDEELFVFKEVKDKPLEASIKVQMLHADGTPYLSEDVNVSYNDRTYNLLTDMSGEAELTLQYAKGRLCTVSTSIGAEQRELSATQEELFLFQEISTPPMFDYNIRFVDQNESPHSGVRVVFTQGDVEWPATLDDDGRMVLPNGNFAVGRSIEVVMHLPSTRIYDMNFELDPDEYEYVIQTVPKEKSHWWILWLLLFIMFLGVICVFAYVVTGQACAYADPVVWPLLY